MHWQTLLRAAVPLGAAALAFFAYRASRRSGEAGHREHLSKHRPPRSPEHAQAVARARLAASAVLIVLVAATAVVFITSTPLADVDIATVTASPKPCVAHETCGGSQQLLSVSGTVGAALSDENLDVYVLAKPASSSDWIVAANTRADESGAWQVDDVPLPASGETLLDVRAVLLSKATQAARIAPTDLGLLPRSRIVSVRTE